jgi:hypothetical protein
MSVSIRIGAVQPQVDGEGAAPKMVDDALSHIARASDLSRALPGTGQCNFRYEVLDAL